MVSSKHLKVLRSLDVVDSLPVHEVSMMHIGMHWDSSNWSCAYDVLLTLFMFLYNDVGGERLASITEENALFDQICAHFVQAGTSTISLETIRDRVRTTLYEKDSVRFPRFRPVESDVVHILDELTQPATPHLIENYCCSACNTVLQSRQVWSFV